MHTRDLQAAFPTIGLVLHGALGGCLVGWLVLRHRRGADRWHHLLLPLVLLLGWIPVALAIGHALPVDAFHPLREGFTLDRAAEVTGEIGDESLLADQFWGVWTGLRGTLRRAVTLHLAFAGATAILLSTLAWRVLPLGTAAIFALVAWLQPATLVAATTDVDASVGAAYVALGALLVAGLPTARGWERAWLVGALATSGVLLISHRVELSALAVPAVVGACLSGTRLDPDPAWHRGLDAVRSRSASWLVLPLVLLASLLLVTPSNQPSVASWGQSAWLVAALNPLHLHGWEVLAWATVVTTPGVVAFAAHGGATSLRSPTRTGAAALALVVLFGVCRLAAHGGWSLTSPGAPSSYELYRYTLPWLPAVLALAVMGASQQATEAPPPAYRLLLVLCLLPPSGLAADVMGMTPHLTVPEPLLLDTSATEEVRDLVRWSEAHPDEALRVQGARWGGLLTSERLAWATLVPRGDGTHRLVAGSAPPARFAYQGLDCAQLGCPPPVGMSLLSETTSMGRPFVHPEHGPQVPEVVVRRWFVATP